MPMTMERLNQLKSLKRLLHFSYQQDQMVGAAIRTLEAYIDSGVAKFLANPEYVRQRPTDLTNGEPMDNVLIHSGALMASLAVSIHHVRNSGIEAAKRGESLDSIKAILTAVKSGLRGLLNRIEYLNHGGYVLRWNQTEFNSRLDGDWQAEPSLDEYSGLMLGLNWAQRFVPVYHSKICDCSNWYCDFHRRVGSILSDINSYLKSTKGWLVRPEQNDLTVRGPHLVANAFPLRIWFQALYGDSGFSCTKPLMPNDSIKTYVENSHRHFSDSCAEHYENTLKPFDIYLKTYPLGTILLMLFPPTCLLGAITTAIPLIISDEDLWGIYARALGKNFDEGTDQTPVFDRFSLSCIGWNEIEEAWNVRTHRHIESDRFGWQCLTAACRVEFTTFEPQQIFDIWNRNIAELATGTPPINIIHVEGFVLSWAVLCHALGDDPYLYEIWPRLFKPLPGCDGSELDMYFVSHPEPTPPRPWVYYDIGTIKLTMICDSKAPNILVTPVVVENVCGKASASIWPTFIGDFIAGGDLSIGQSVDSYIGGFELLKRDMDPKIFLLITVWNVEAEVTGHDEYGEEIIKPYIDPTESLQEMVSQLEVEINRYCEQSDPVQDECCVADWGQIWEFICKNSPENQLFEGNATVELQPDDSYLISDFENGAVFRPKGQLSLVLSARNTVGEQNCGFQLQFCVDQSIKMHP